MRDFLESTIGIIAAVLLTTLFTKISQDAPRIFNVFNIVVFYFAYRKGETRGAVMGTVCGLVHDSFSIGVFGISGISKTLMGYVSGFISRQINISTFFRRFVFMLVMFSVEMFLWMGLYSFVISEKIYTAKGLIFAQPVCTALLALFLFPLFRKLEKVLSRRSS